MARRGIMKLDPATVGKIAAGEVVERPSSVVKELLENSLDSGAGRITIEIKEAPEKYIRITDDGCGISPEDGPLVFEGHATSKIENINDLEAVGTLGFRGEALASIAAVARVELTSSTDGNVGIHIEAEGGEVRKIEELGCAKGTTIKVADIFYNTPARLKFLKTKNTETNRIIDIVTRYALGAPGVHIRLLTYGREVLNAPATVDIRENFAYVYGVDAGRKMIEIAGDDERVRLYGIISSPDLNKGTSQDISFFVNGRFIQSSVLVQALMEGYRTQLMKHRYPMGAVHIEVDPRTVDVNVHPAKTEIRFRNEKAVVKFLEGAVTDVLGALTEGPEMDADGWVFPEDAGICRDDGIHPLEGIGELSVSETNEVQTDAAVSPVPAAPGIQTKLEPAGAREIEPRFLEPGPEGESRLPRMKIIGQVHNTYILAETKDGMLLIDQHAAAERINLEKIHNGLEENRPMQQELIAPAEVSLDPKQVNALMENKEVLAGLGFEVEEFGKDSVLVRAVPVVLGRVTEMSMVDELLAEIVDLGKAKAMQEFTDSVAHIVACKASVKAGDPMDREQMEALVRALQGTLRPYSCAHGRPTLLTLTKTELEKRFKRIV